ncbi:MAG: SH3 domain-containing protein [Chloroflexi bacterium]|nr:SH3 domain-containing protein [Chloroflexota bacterium]
MTKRIMTMFLLLTLAVGAYFMQGKADGGEVKPTQTKPPTATDAPEACNVQTGIEGGTVNLRACGGTSCAVLDIVTEGERLTILAAGNWTQVTTESGVTGWLNSKYCKGK